MMRTSWFSPPTASPGRMTNSYPDDVTTFKSNILVLVVLHLKPHKGTKTVDVCSSRRTEPVARVHRNDKNVIRSLNCAEVLKLAAGIFNGD